MVGKGDELTPAEVASEFSVSPATVRRWGDRGWLPPSRRMPGSGYRRYTRAAVDAFRAKLEAGEYDEPVEPAANRSRNAAARRKTELAKPVQCDAPPTEERRP